MRKNWIALVLLAGVFALLVTACGGNDDDDAAPTTPAGTPQGNGLPADAAPAEEQVLNVGLPAEPEFLDPHLSQGEADIAIERLLFRGLLTLDPEGKPVPAVAAEVPTKENGGVSEDGLTYTYKLKSGQLWSDGEPLTAHDFEFSFKRAIALKGPYSTFLYNIVGAPEIGNAEEVTDEMVDAIAVRAIDDMTLEVELRQPQPTFNILVTLLPGLPVREDVVGQDGWTEPGKLVGNGPYVLDARTERANITLVKNANYTAGDEPALERISVTIVEDFGAGFDAWQTGQLDIMELSASRKPVVDGDPALQEQFILGPKFETRGVHMNQRMEIFQDVRVRQALSYAIDRERFVEVVWQGMQVPGASWIPPGHPGYSAELDAMYPHDVEQARELMAEAGYPDGEGFPTITILLRDDPTLRSEGEFLQVAWEEALGIDVELEVVDSQTRGSRFREGQFELTNGGWFADYPDPENWLPELWGSEGGFNVVGYSSPEFDEAIMRAAQATNEADRFAAYHEAERILIEDAGVLAIYHTARPTMVNTSRVGGVQGSVLDAGWLGSAFIETVYIKAQ